MNCYNLTTMGNISLENKIALAALTVAVIFGLFDLHPVGNHIVHELFNTSLTTVPQAQAPDPPAPVTRRYSTILGPWHDPETAANMEFFPNHTVILTAAGETLSGQFTGNGFNETKLTFPDLKCDILSLNEDGLRMHLVLKRRIFGWEAGDVEHVATYHRPFRAPLWLSLLTGLAGLIGLVVGVGVAD